MRRLTLRSVCFALVAVIYFVGDGAYARHRNRIVCQYTEPAGERLRVLVEKNFARGNVYIGGTTGWRNLERGAGAILQAEFGYVTPENDFKESAIHPEPGVWNWSRGDAWIKYCKEHNQVIRIHGPISPQCSDWAKDDARTATELRKNMREYMTALYRRYGHVPQVRWMDVVNETVTKSGKWTGPKPGIDKWENPWTQLGVDTSDPLQPPIYIKEAFQIANRYASKDVQLIINQHGGMEDAVWNKIKYLVRYLRKNNLRVDGIGWQAHIDCGWEKEGDNLKKLAELISWAHRNRLSFHITECNVWMKKDTDTPAAQAATFAAVLRTVLAERNTGQVTFNVWGPCDALSFKKDLRGTLFDERGKAKPAYYAVQRELIGASKPYSP